jgi:hypothetical protein
LERRAGARVKETLSRLIKVKGARELRESPYVVKERRGKEHGKERRGRVKRRKRVRHGRRSEGEKGEQEQEMPN